MDSINIVTKTPDSPAIVEGIDITTDLSSSASSDFSDLSPDVSSEGSIFSGISITKIIAIIIILAFLGFNVFHYLANVTDKTTSFFDYITKDIRKVFNYLIGQPIKDTVVESGEGTKAGINATAQTLTSGVDYVENIVEPRQHEKDYNSATKQLQKASRSRRSVERADEDESNSSIQEYGNKGHCYVGTDRGFRTCVKVNNMNECLSGDIFPSRDICINPSLRE